MLKFVGTTFPATANWYPFERATIDSIQNQINSKYPTDNNLLINTTWFGPQFNNGEYDKFLTLSKSSKFDNLFLLSSTDPVFLNQEKLNDLISLVNPKQTVFLGNFDSEHSFNLPSIVVSNIFKSYNSYEIKLEQVDWLYLNYNRKPRPHRIEFVNLLYKNHLEKLGIVTLGKVDNSTFNTGIESVVTVLTLNEMNEDNALDTMGHAKNNELYGIPDDVHSLGNLNIWNRHFLNIVSETEFYPWDNTFVTEKTWKPIIGLRPFVINGQAKIYQWLRHHGFCTFNQYFPGINLEEANELEVHDAIVKVIKYLREFTKQELYDLYNTMLPDLQHNRQRFFEFAQEQQHRIDNVL